MTSSVTSRPTAPALDHPLPARWVRRRRPLSARRAVIGATYAAPLACFVALLFLLPLLTVGKMSLSDWSLLGGDARWNAPNNFGEIGRDRLLGPSIWFTVEYTFLTTAVLIPIALGLALLLQESRRWNTWVRTAVLLPGALGLASSALLFWGLYSPTVGPLSTWLVALGVVNHPVSFLGAPVSALWSTIVLVVWRFTGFSMLLLLIGLQAIPADVYEAARLDGATRPQILRRITLPLLRPSLALALILSVTGSLLAFDQFFILTQGGPDNSTLTIVQLIYRTAFMKFDLGSAAALSVCLLLVLVLFNIAQFRLLRGRSNS